MEMLNHKKSEPIRHSESNPEDEDRSEELNGMIGKMPPWITRWGITIILVFILLVFGGLSFVKYPAIASASITIINSNPPVEVKSILELPIETLSVFNGQTVFKGQEIATLENDMNLYNLEYVDSNLERLLDANDLNTAIKEIKLRQDIKLSTLSALYRDLNRSIYNYKRNGAKEDDLTTVLNDIRRLEEGIHRWKEEYIITSPATGRINFIQPIHKGYYTRHDETIAAIVPEEIHKPLVTGKIQAGSLAQIKIGQTVLISLDEFPWQEYGHLIAQITSIGEAKVNNEYTILLDLSKGLVTTKKLQIPQQSTLSGIGEILIANKSILQRIFSSYQIGR